MPAPHKYFGYYIVPSEDGGYSITAPDGREFVGSSTTLKQAQERVKDHRSSVSANPTVTTEPQEPRIVFNPISEANHRAKVARMTPDEKTTMRRNINRALDTINTLRTKFVYYKIGERVVQVAMTDETIPIDFENAHVVDYSEYLMYRAKLRYERRQREKKAGTFVRHGKRIKR